MTKDEMKAIVSETIEKSAGSIAAEVAKIIKEEAQAADSGASQASSEERVQRPTTQRIPRKRKNLSQKKKSAQ